MNGATPFAINGAAATMLQHRQRAWLQLTGAESLPADDLLLPPVGLTADETTGIPAPVPLFVLTIKSSSTTDGPATNGGSIDG